MQVRHFLTLLLLPLSMSAASLRLKPVALVPHGSNGDFMGNGCVMDSDRDGWLEFTYQRAGFHFCWEILEYRPVNRLELVKSDTAVHPLPPGRIMTGCFLPMAAGDIDADGKADIAGIVSYLDSVTGMLSDALCTVESPDSFSYPDSINWLYLSNPGVTAPVSYADMDRDGSGEIVVSHYGTMVFENIGDDRESLVCHAYPYNIGRYAVADFDQNGRTDFSAAAFDWTGVCECVGDNEYVLVCSLSTGRINTHGVFLGNDVDRNGRPEFFVMYLEPGTPLRDTLLLYMFEATAEHEYAFWQVDTAVGGWSCGKSGCCADLDGDGFEEVIWFCFDRLIILKASGPHRFERVFTRQFAMSDVWAAVNYGDFNANGYNEVVVTGILTGNREPWTMFLEVEAVRVLYPDRERELHAGDTCLVRWRLFTPPRCDSVSLFLLTDTIVPPGERFWPLDTIVTGLAPTESVYAWVVPNTTLAWAKIVAIAYGPGWQFDASDSSFRILPVGKAETPTLTARKWSLTATPAIGPVSVVYEVPHRALVRLSLFDALGRLVSRLDSGTKEPGRYSVRLDPSLSPGIYYVRLEAPGIGAVRKAVLAE